MGWTRKLFLSVASVVLASAAVATALGATSPEAVNLSDGSPPAVSDTGLSSIQMVVLPTGPVKEAKKDTSSLESWA